MAGLFFFLILIAGLIAGASFFVRRGGVRVHDATGRTIGISPPGGLARVLVVAFGGFLLLIVLLTTIRVVPVGHALVIFNTVTKDFTVAQQGIAFIPPFVSVTAEYDLRRQEYTMSSVTGEGRREGIDDSMWSPTQEGLQVGIDLTVWHHVDPLRVASIHQRIGPDYEDKIIRPAVRSVIRLVISEYPVMDVYSSKRARIQDEINVKIKQLLEKDGFVIDEIVLRDVRFTPEFTKAIEAKQVAQQAAEQMKYTLEKELKEAERKVIEATGRANSIPPANASKRSTSPGSERCRFASGDSSTG